MEPVRQPGDLLGAASARALTADLSVEPLFGIWTRFRWDVRGGDDLPLPVATELAPGVWRVRLRALEPGTTPALEVTLPAARGERFVGFGERFNAVDQRGQRLETWCEEGAIGLGEKTSPLLDLLGVDFNPFPKGPTTAYKPLPWFISSRGYGLLVDTTAPVFHDVATGGPRVTIRIAASAADLILFLGTPAEVLERFTARVGRHQGLPDWALAPWNDVVGGSDAARRVTGVLRERGIPSSALWMEDWQGGHWTTFPGTGLPTFSIFPTRRTADRDRYPDLEALNAELRGQGFRSLGYYYPYVDADDPDFAKADAAGWFLRDGDGATADVYMETRWRCGQVDLTNPEARAWYAGELRRSVELGFDGWMADFGEYTPAHAVAADGEPGTLHHNRYPLLWAELNRDVLREARPDGDFVFFSRSAWLGQQAISPVLWSGDSNTDFERWDGLPSNLPALLSAGLSGFSVWTVDVGGYMSLYSADRDTETLARWAELGALLPVMRTHHGTQPAASVQFDHDEGTLAHYGAWARLHVALFPRFRQLLDEAAASGLPCARALLLHHPDQPRAWGVEDQFLLGPDLLAAPVVERGATGRSVWLPAGHDWVDLWTGHRHEGGRDVRVDAPLGVSPLFLRADGLLATFDTPVDTLVGRAELAAPTLRALEDADASVALFAGPDFTGPVTLWDGSLVEAATAGAPDGTAPLTPATPAPHALLPAALLGAWRPVAAGDGMAGSLADGEGVRLAVRGVRARRWTLYRAVGADRRA